MASCSVAPSALGPRGSAARAQRLRSATSISGGSVRALRPPQSSKLRAARVVPCDRRMMHCRAESTARKIEGLADKFCNDFECTGSPAIEPTVRALAKDIERSVCNSNRTMTNYLMQVKYSDPLRSFEGREKYATMKYISDTIGDPKASITGLKMETPDVVLISYRLEGNTPAGKLDMDFEERYTMNQITGRVLEHKVSWDTARTGAPAAAFYVASRTAYSKKLDLQDASDNLNATFDDMMGQDDQMQGDPTDPLKFFQQQDNTYNDMFVFAAGVTLIYAVVQVLTL